MLPNVVGRRLYCQRHGGHSKPPLPPFVKYFRTGDSFLIYLVNSRWGEEEREFYIMEMMEWVIISHIFIMADIGPLWYRPPFGHCSGSLSAHCSPQWAKQALIPCLFGMTMFTSYHSIRSQEHDTHPSVSKCVNRADTEELFCKTSKDNMDWTFVSKFFYLISLPHSIHYITFNKK